MKKTKKNNKGFSLVELIVVVLIMAIIAVALAPQVMKWVGNSKVSTDVSNYDSMVANCQLALTDAEAYKAISNTVAATAAVITIKKAETTCTAVDGSALSNKFTDAMNALDSNWKSIAAKAIDDDANAYVIVITNTGTVVRVKQPDGSTVK